MSAIKERNKEHRIFKLLKKGDTSSCLKTIEFSSVQELLELRNNNLQNLVEAIFQQMNADVLEKLILKCGSQICHVLTSSEYRYQELHFREQHNRSGIFKMFLRQSRTTTKIVEREKIFDILCTMKDIDFSDIEHENFYQEYPLDWLWKLLNLDTNISDVIIYKIKLEVIHLLKSDNLDIQKKILLDSLLDKIYCHPKFYKKVKNEIVERYLDNNYNLQELPEYFDKLAKLYDFTDVDSLEFHRSIFRNNKALFDYFYDQGYHLVKYKHNILDMILNFELNQILKDDVLCSFDMAIGPEYDDSRIDALCQQQPRLKEIIDDMIFASSQVYYIMKLLDSHAVMKCGRYAKMMLKQFIVPFKFPNLMELSVNTFNDCEITNEDDIPKEVNEISNKIRKFHCLNCAKVYHRLLNDMTSTIITYNREVDAFAYPEQYNYLPPTLMQITGFSFCSQKCESDYYLF